MGMKHGVLILKIFYRAYSLAVTVSDNLYTLHGLATTFVINVQGATDRVIRVVLWVFRTYAFLSVPHSNP